MSNRVLLVDDDPGVRASMKKVLEKAGYEVMAAADGQEATAHFESDQTDLVLLDINLPFQSGWDVFERLTTQHPVLPVIIITALPNQHQFAKAAGAGALMEKPIEVPVLLETIDRLLKEPPETRLHRLCGYRTDTPLVPAASLTRTKAISPEAARIRSRPHDVRSGIRRG